MQSLFRLIRFRNSHPAFEGEFTISGGGTRLVATWTAGEEVASLEADLTSGKGNVVWTEGGERREAMLTDLP